MRSSVVACVLLVLLTVQGAAATADSVLMNLSNAIAGPQITLMESQRNALETEAALFSKTVNEVYNAFVGVIREALL